ncbi:MAG: hypothetical protein LJU34_07415, partial [Oscillospiraceae bacterium]|nr:hypothetical protein [Oscillospiraceae bacterium]
ENEVAATCTEEGSYDSVVYCTVCEEELSRESVTVPATGHTWNEGEVTTAATATTDGEMTYTCTVCGETKTETIAATGSPDNTQTQTVCDDLTEVPAGLADKYTTVEELTEDIISMVTASAGYTEENTAVYDVKLQISTDGGLTWVDATEENFPEGGITVTLPYPDGTDSSYDFTVVHMFAVTSARLGIVAGETESPAVTKGETTISFTLTGLSPVAIAWKEGAATETPASTTTATVEPTTTAASPNTGDDASIGLWLALAMACVCGLAVTVAAKKKKG